MDTPQPPPSDAFIYARTEHGQSAAPMLIINTNIVGKNPSQLVMSGPMQIPVQVSAVAAGVAGRNPCSADEIGGGAVDTFAFTSSLVAATGTNKVSANFAQKYTLADISACSSAFYAASLAEPLQAALSALHELSDDDLHSHVAGFIHNVEHHLTSDIRTQLVAQKNQVSGLADLVPQYNYWPISDATAAPSSNRLVEFTDGGDLENTGVAGLLAQVQNGLSQIIAFVNGAEVLEMKDSQLIAATQMAPLFGVCYDEQRNQFAKYLPQGLNPFTGLTDPTGFLQIFDNSDSQFDHLRQGLYQANGGAEKTGAAFFKQSLRVVNNPLYGIAGGGTVNILWVQNSINLTWQNQIVDPMLKQKLRDGQAQGGDSEFADFPYYSTMKKISASAAETNTLAQMWAWNVSAPTSPLSLAILDMFND